MKKLVLIDGNSIAYRAFYALPLLENKQGLYTNSVYGFTQILIKIINDNKPDYILVAFDAGKNTFRHKEYKEYKGKRMKTPQELSGQFPMIKKLLDAYNIKYFDSEDYEADDIIGTVSKLAEEEKIETIIYTGDKDMFQLATNEVKVYLTRKGITQVEMFGPEEINEKYGLTPIQIVDLKGLMGDSSDNIPGIPGVGEKTALKLLHQYQSVEEVLENVENISGVKLKEKIHANKEQALLSKRLATIFREVPIDFEVRDLKLADKNEQEVYELLKKWEFNSLVERLGLENEKDVEREVVSIDIKNLSISSKDIWEKKFASKELIAINVETNSEKVHDWEIYGIAISNGSEHLFLTLDQLKNWQSMIDWLNESEAKKWVYDAKRVELAFYWNQVAIKGIASDVLLSNYLLNPSDGISSLTQIAGDNNYFGCDNDEEVYGKGAKRKIPDTEILKKHIGIKASALYSLVPILDEKLKKNDLIGLLYDVELPLSEILAKMEKSGMSIDLDCLEDMKIEIGQILEELKSKIYTLAGKSFNINSPKQLGDILFNTLQLPIIKKTKTGYSTDAEVLDKLEPHHPIIGEILLYRQLGKLYSTYVEGLIKMVNRSTGKVYTSFNQAITATGRLSSTDPNLQNIPIRLEEGRKIRKAFIPEISDWIIMSADYSQIELRVLAHISKDENLIIAFNNNMDIHTKTAMDIFNVEKENVTANMRRQAKAVNFGIVYGISDYGLSQNLNISRKEAKEFIDKYFSLFSGVKKYMNEIVGIAKESGYVSTLLNRRRYLPDINSRNFNIRSFAERTAMNTPIQGTAADIIKLAMIKVNKELEKQKLSSKLKLQVHDELIFEVPPGELEKMKKIIPEIMENAIKLDVPLKVDVNIGKTWYEAK